MKPEMNKADLYREIYVNSKYGLNNFIGREKIR